MRIGILFVIVWACSAPLFAQTLPNTSVDDYAPAFRSLPGGGAELWFTSAMSSRSGRSRQMMVAACTPNGFDTAHPLDDPNINFIDRGRSAANDVLLNGVPSFTCDGMRGVFVSNRLVNAKDMGNDIYEMILSNDGHWSVHRIDSVCSPYWDDTPNLSPDGNTLYFASDRRHPGTKQTELFYARRNAMGEWSAAKPIDALDNASGNHEAPCVGPDGYFYFSTNVIGHYEIWRSPMNNGLPTTAGEPVSFPSVNDSLSDQTDPVFSPGGNWMLFASNRADSGKIKDEDIYWVSLDTTPLHVLVNVQKQVRMEEPQSGLIYDKQFPYSTEVHADGDQGAVVAHSNAAGNYEIALPRGTNPASDLQQRNVTFTVPAPSTKFVAPPGRLRYALDTRDTLLHIALQAWDTTSINDSVYRQSFPIADVRFFIEGYWGPTTFAYRNYLMRAPLASCPTFFADTDCLALGTNGDPCPSNNLYSYRYDTTPASSTIKTGKRETTVRSLAYRAERADVSPCFDYQEFRASGPLYAGEVDAALDTLVSNMRTALHNPRVQLAADSSKKIHITITGFTDPKTVKAECDYSGETVDFSKELVQMIDTGGNPDRSVERRFTQGEPMDHQGDGGNPLLSSLRAFWTATLLDSLWSSHIPEYAELRDRNLLVLDAIGRSVKIVKQGKEISFAQRRSISVDITVSAEGRHTNGQQALPGQIVDAVPTCNKRMPTLTERQ